MSEKIKALQSFITDDQILECVILFETRKMDAAKLLSGYVFPKWHISTIDAVHILNDITTQFNQKLI